MSLYVKKRRVAKGYLRPSITSKLPNKEVFQIQGLIRRRIAIKSCQFYRRLLRLRLECQWAKRIKLRSAMTRETRDKETYFIQRCAIGRIESESINKYIEKTESKFEANWLIYEQSLQKYLTNSNK